MPNERIPTPFEELKAEIRHARRNRVPVLIAKLEALGINVVSLLGLALASEAAYRASGPPVRLEDAVDADLLLVLESPSFRRRLRDLAQGGPSKELDRVTRALGGRTTKALEIRSARKRAGTLLFDKPEVQRFAEILRRAHRFVDPDEDRPARVRALVGHLAKRGDVPELLGPAGVPGTGRNLVGDAAALLLEARAAHAGRRGPVDFATAAVRLAAAAHGRELGPGEAEREAARLRDRVRKARRAVRSR